MTAYDVFISYRRDGGAAEARLIQAALQSRRVRAFLDVTELGRGYFDDALLRSIEQTPNFVVILSPHALDRAESAADWLRKEIAHALRSERNVVPLIMPGFQFPPKLPAELKNLPRHQGMDYSHLYFDAMMEKLMATLDLSGTDEERANRERSARELAEHEERERVQREELQAERTKLEQARLSVERLKQETDARRRSLELHRREGFEKRQPPDHPPDRDSGLPHEPDRSRPGQPVARDDAEPRAVAFWSLVLVAFAFFSTASGSEASGAFAAGVAFTALAAWLRVKPQQAGTTGLAVSALTAVVMIGAALSQRFDLGRLSIAAFAAGAAMALWRLSRAAPPIRTAAPPAGPFGRRLGTLVGVAEPFDASRLRLFIGARLVAGIAFWWDVQANQAIFSSFRVNYLWVAWVSAALPLALAVTFRWLRNPLLSICTAAVIASLVDPAFYQGGRATLTVAGYLVGSLLFAAVAEEVDRDSIAVWLGAAAANLGAVLLGWLWGVRFSGWSQAGPNLYRVTLLSAVFAAVFAGGTLLPRRAERPSTS